MCVAHTAAFAQCQALAAGLQLLLAFVIRLACSQTLRSLLVRTGHAAVACNIFLGMGIELGGRRTHHRRLAVAVCGITVAVVIMCPGRVCQQQSCSST